MPSIIAEIKGKSTNVNKITKDLDGVGKSTERLGRNQTRLAQASASAGRSFAAQSAGLGGVVGVYAAAAANVFAITAAFTALNRAAQFATIISGTEQLANAVGSSANEVISSLKNITEGQLSIVEAATQANLALSAGFNVDQIEELGEVALKSSRALGRNLTDAFQRITRGAIKLEPELLDEIGIFTRIEPAVEAYAASLNKSASQLTQFERRQAFVNQVIKDGQAAFQDIEDSGKSTQEVFESLVANFSDLAIVATKFVADSLVPLASFLDQNLGNRIVLLGAVGTLVFGRLRESLGQLATQGLTALGTRLEGLGESLRSRKVDVEQLAAAQAKASAAFIGGGALTGAGRGAGAQIKRDLTAGPLTTGRAQEIQKEIPALLREEKKLRDELRAKVKEDNSLREKATEQIRKSATRTRALNKTQALVNTQLATSGVLANTLAKGIRGAGVAASFLATQLGRAFIALQVIVGAFTTLQFLGSSLFDIDLFQITKDLISSIGEEARKTAEGFQAIQKAAEEANTSITSILGVAPDITTETLERSLELSSLSALQLERRVRGLNAQIDQLQNRPTFLQKLFPEQLKDNIKELSDELKATELALSGAGERALDTSKAVSVISEKAGLESLSIAAGGFASKLLEINDGALQVSGINFGNFNDLSEDAAVGVTKLADGLDKSSELANKLEEGNINASRASKDAITVVSQLNRALEAARKRSSELVDITSPEFMALQKFIALTKKEIEDFGNTTQKVVNNVVELENIAKTLQKQGGGQFKFLDESVISGVFSAETGKIARNEEQQAKFRTQNLNILMDQLENARELNLDQAQINELETIRNKLLKISQADLIKAVQTTEKQIKANEKILQQEESKIKITGLQNDLLRAQVQAQADNRAEKMALQVNKDRLSVMKSQLTLAQEMAKAKEQERKQSNELAALDRERAKLQSDLRDAGFAQADAAADATSASKVAALENRKAAIEQQTLTTRNQIIQMEIDIIRFKAQEDKARIDREIAANERKRVDDIENVKLREAALTKEFIMNREKVLNERTLFEEQEKIAAFQREVADQELQNQINAARRQKEQLPLQKEIADAQSKAAFEARKFALDEIQRRAELQAEKIRTDSAFLKRYGELVEQESRNRGTAFTAGSGTEFEDAGSAATANINTILGQIGQRRANNQTQLDQDLERNTLQNQLGVGGAQETIDLLEKRQALNTAIAAVEEKIANEKRKANNSELTFLTEKFQKQLENTGLEKRIINENAETQLQKLQAEKEAIDANLQAQIDYFNFQRTEQAKLKELLKGVRDIISNEIGAVTDKLFQNIADGKSLTEGLGETLRNSFENVRKKVLEETLIKPMQEKFTSFFNQSFGFEDAGGIDTAKVDQSGALLVRMADGTLGPIEQGEKVTGNIKEKATSAFEAISNKLGEFKDKGLNVFSSFGDKLGGVFSSLGQGAGSIFSSLGGLFKGGGEGGGSLLSGITGMFGGKGGGGGGLLSGIMGMFGGGASGGFVPFSAYQRLAAGGLARDRVPSLLEPGEFVMKRSAANSIGAPALNQMNATGKAGGNVVVNIENQGTPQDATASEPRFDGEKFVIDIVTRDLRNNGPIRKSLRGGGAG